MRAWIMGFLVPGLALAQTPAVEILGKALPVVAGPMPSERLRDLAGGPGNSGIDVKIRRSARRTGFLPAVEVPRGEVLAITHEISSPAGWQAYRVDTAPGEKIHARLRADHEPWFVVKCVNRNGQLEQGMLQNLIRTGNPEATYVNPGKGPVTVYFVVDTTEILTGKEPYVLTLTREKVNGAGEPAKP
ncbi:hypothetical protein [Mesoterricola silvestris]|uniref:Uncharacterized protein n=1 Tax=Mesoterricola silvestris TaxID=2927979 RepID=A0AA48K9G9_9BACT|nr:hypothetical protein [Mesoterricola silvestris]BDU73055.1 hypothetical protein METEAL_22290 [Mesoterricola silvestris]